MKHAFGLLTACFLFLTAGPASPASAQETPPGDDNQKHYAHIVFNAGIDRESTKALIDIFQDLDEDTDEIHLVISSPGGNGYRSMLLASIVNAIDIPVYTYAAGNVSSAGLNLFLAGDKRYAEPYATFLIHAYSFPSGEMNTPTTYYDELYDSQQSQIAAAAGFLADRTRLSEKEAFEILSESHKTLSAYDAVVQGLVDEIRGIPWRFTDGETAYFEVILD